MRSRALLCVIGCLPFLACGAASPPASSSERTGGGGTSSVGSGNGTAAGTLTAGIWDDSLNFELFKTYRGTQTNRLADFTDAEQSAAAATQRTPATRLDIAVVVDTTGSMGDEIEWLQTELKAIADDVAAAHPGVPQRWALVHYRDEGDDYVVRFDDFTSSVSSFQLALAKLEAGGGGDFPEAPDQALAQAAALSWDVSGDTAKLVFWVADAPPHDGRAAEFSTTVRALQSKGAHVYPVASSGIDTRTEYAMRASAQLTLGRYLFLTDDSGVGGAHLEPSIPCYVVTKLNHAVERSIDSELAGARVEVDPAKVIRTVGSPMNGQCALQGGTVAQVF
jgi:Mg-chelatase subunit ChlD